MVGQRLAKYEIHEEVGRGGMAIVYRGTDTSLQREVAIKVLHPFLADDAESKRRLQREAHAVAKLRHENILEIFDYSGPESEQSYIVTEFIEGETLRRFLDRRGEDAIPYPEIAACIVREIARALAHAHRGGIIHRDVKPENVMISADGRIKLMDFGIAQMVDTERLTVTGQLLGSPAYMSPEHVLGRPLDFRTDVFAVGVLLYQLATGQLPFRGKNPHEVLKRIGECDYPDPREVRPQLGGHLSGIIKKALARDPDGRYPDVSPLCEALDAFLGEVGIDDPRAEAAAFFQGPEAYAVELRARLVPALCDAAERARKQRRIADALDLLDRALGTAPDDPRATELLDRITSGQRRRRTWIGAAVGSLVLAGFAVASPRLLRPKPAVIAETRQPARGQTKPPQVAMRHIPAGKQAPAPAEETAPPPPEPPRERAPHLPAEARPFEISVVQKSAWVELDGVKVQGFGPKNRVVWVPGGARKLVVTCGDPCYPETIPISPADVGKKIPVRLKYRPATLQLASDTPDTTYMIGDRATKDRQMLYELAGESSSELVTVSARAEGFATLTKKVRLSANETSSVTFEFKAARESDLE